MEHSNQCVAFTSVPLALSSRATSFYGLSASRPRSVAPVTLRRSSRARILCLGAAPPPPPPKDSEDSEAPADDVTEEEPTMGDESITAEDITPDITLEEAAEVTADDILNSPSFLKKKLEIVQKELLALKQKADGDDEGSKDEKSRYVRLAADFENYRRRSIEELRQQDVKSTAKVCKEILTVLDNFERATNAVDPQTDQERSIVSSYSAINKQLLEALVKLNVEPIDAVGQVFDPEMHEAIQKMESDDYREDVVCQQFQRGYKIGDILIRAAIVAVSTGPGPEGEEDPESVDAEVVAEGDNDESEADADQSTDPNASQ